MSATRSQAAVNKWIRKQEARLGIADTGKPASKPASTMTVRLILADSDRARTDRAHAGADLLIADNPAYDATCARFDAELAEIIEGGVGLAAPSSVMVND